MGHGIDGHQGPHALADDKEGRVAVEAVSECSQIMAPACWIKKMAASVVRWVVALPA
jgi:hypothetical protein